LSPEKGHKNLIEAFALIKIKLIHSGDCGIRGLKNRRCELINKYGLDERVHNRFRENPFKYMAKVAFWFCLLFSRRSLCFNRLGLWTTSHSGRFGRATGNNDVVKHGLVVLNKTTLNLPLPCSN
jgi:glycosyltransferase involved in cell wall biosynthesis